MGGGGIRQLPTRDLYITTSPPPAEITYWKRLTLFCRFIWLIPYSTQLPQAGISIILTYLSLSLPTLPMLADRREGYAQIRRPEQA
jgi:hypothetical protein